MSGTDRTAWAQFWAMQKGAEAGCLPQGIAAIDAVQTQVWRDFARMLPKRAAVLDLATGGGAVLRKLASARPDLKLYGVDSAPTLPAAPKGASIKAGIAMEELPFSSAHFDAVTSQFGYEYGKTGDVATQVARVLRPGGAIHFIVHHAAGPVVAHNRSRRDALVWAAKESGCLARARQLARARAAAALPTPDSFRADVQEAQRLFPQQAVAQEFTLAVYQCLELGRATPPAQTLGALDELEDKARNEIARINTLERAAVGVDRMEMVVGELGRGGIDAAPLRLLFERPGAVPFAWLLSGRRNSV